MTLKRHQTGLAVGAFACSLLTAVALGVLVFVDIPPARSQLATTLRAFAAVMAMVGGTLWVRMTVREVAFHLWGEARGGRAKPD